MPSETRLETRLETPAYILATSTTFFEKSKQCELATWSLYRVHGFEVHGLLTYGTGPPISS
eukprot:3229378-Prymnesium_polylepis.1